MTDERTPRTITLDGVEYVDIDPNTMTIAPTFDCIDRLMGAPGDDEEEDTHAACGASTLRR